MRTIKVLGSAVLAMAIAAPTVVIAQGPPPPPPPGYGYGNDPWRMPPREYDAVRRQGFQDGMYGAQKDVENHRRPDPNNRDEYRHPAVRGRDVGAYREGFREGYHRAMDHMMHHYR